MTETGVLLTILDALPVFVSYLDAEGRYRFVNRMYETRFRQPREEILGRTAGEILGPEMYRVVGPHVDAALAGRPASFDVRVVFPDGSARWLHTTLIPDRPAGSDVVGVVVFAEDVTELKRARQALEQNEQRFRDLFEEAPLAYISVGRDGRVERANRNAAELFGRPTEQIVGRRIVDLHADTAEGKGRAQQILEQFRRGESREEEVEIVRADGSHRWIRVSVNPVHNASGEVIADRGIGIDITERKLAQRALRESQRRLERTLESAMDAIVTLSADGTITLFNSAAEDVFRCSADEVLGSSFDRFASPAFRELLAKGSRAFEKGSSRYLWAPEGLSALRADGDAFPVEATLSPFEMQGERYLTLILRDVAEREKAEADLRRLRLENLYLQETMDGDRAEIVGRSPAIERVLAEVRKVAPTDSTVLVVGETGTGKELIAQAVHRLSPRADKVLVKVNCAALPGGVIESELFGHEKGAFTGALTRRVGRFELAHSSTILLDEVADLPLELQAKLLRVLQEGEFERLGSATTRKVDVRVIAATNWDLEAAVEERRFRQDLYYRLNVFPIRVPPLRERREDIPLLARHFTLLHAGKMGKRIDEIPESVMNALLSYPWRGNVRELQNVIERAVILSSGPRLELSENLLRSDESLPTAGPQTLEEIERRHILDVLEQTGWQVAGEAGAAKILGLKRTTLESRMKRLGIRRPT